MGLYCYEYPRPAVTVDAVILTQKDSKHFVLLIRRKNEPFINHWALPGGFVDEKETLEEAIQREIREELQIDIDLKHVRQFRAYSDPHRDPRQRTITIVFVVWVSDNIVFKAGDDASEAQWFPLDDLPELAFDHHQIINDLRNQIPNIIQAKDQEFL